MEFDEIEYLEKTVEEAEDRDCSKRKKQGVEKNERSYRKREVSEEAEVNDVQRAKKYRGGDGNGERLSRDKDRHRREREKDAEIEERERRSSVRHGERDKERSGREFERERDRDPERNRRDREREREWDVDRGRRDNDTERERERDRQYGRRERSERDKDKEKERHRDRERERERDKEREREVVDDRDMRERSRSMSRRNESDLEGVHEIERDLEAREGRRSKEKKDATEPESDPERDQRTVFAYQMPLKATERDVYEFFSKAGKVRDVRLIMDRNSRRSKGVGYIEYYDAMCVPTAIALSGQHLFGQPVMVKPSEAEKNLVQSNASGTGGGGPFGPVDRKLYVGNLHFNMTELQLRQLFEPFGMVELVQMPLDLETGQCKGFGFIQFAQVECAKKAQGALNGKLEIAGRTIRVSSVTEHAGQQDAGAKSADFDDDDGGGLGLSAQSRALLMQKLDRTGIATSIVGAMGGPLVLNGSAPNQQTTVLLPVEGQAAVGVAPLPFHILSAPVYEAIGQPSEYLLLKNLFDPATESEPDFDLDIKEDVEGECSKFGRVNHIYVDKNSAGYVYLWFGSVEAASLAQRSMHARWFARRSISAIFLQPYEYQAKFGSHPQ